MLNCASDHDATGLTFQMWHLHLAPTQISNFTGPYQPRWAVFSTRVDRLQLLNVPYSNIVLPMTAVPADKPQTMVMVVFR